MSQEPSTELTDLYEETMKVLDNFKTDMEMTDDQKKFSDAIKKAITEQETNMTEEERDMTTKIPGAIIVTDSSGKRFIDVPKWIGKSGAHALINNWTVQQIKENGVPMVHHRQWKGLEWVLLEKEKQKQAAIVPVVVVPSTTTAAAAAVTQ